MRSVVLGHGINDAHALGGTPRQTGHGQMDARRIDACEAFDVEGRDHRAIVGPRWLDARSVLLARVE